MPERGALLARMPGSGVPGPVKSNLYFTKGIGVKCNCVFK